MIAGQRGFELPGRRACIDLFASYGLNRIDDTGELCWGSALLALHADAGFDTYIFCDKNPEAIKDSPRDKTGFRFRSDR